MEQEIWKDVVGYEGLYQVSNMGNIRAYNCKYQKNLFPDTTQRGLTPQLNRNGYLQVGLFRGKTQKTHAVHRLVADAFIQKDDIFATTVNHKNEVKTDNRAENLEWVSQKDNCRKHYERNPRKVVKNYASKKPIKCVETGEVFDSITAMAKAYNLNANGLRACIYQGLKHYKGYHWELI